ncbi:Uncharacterised protein [Neisseria meningitidis]|nr:Uncharacterised protein [Neisseria meningitidis]
MVALSGKSQHIGCNTVGKADDVVFCLDKKMVALSGKSQHIGCNTVGKRMMSLRPVA